MGVVTINQAVDGLTAVNAASLNTNFNAIANVLNGNIDGNNITNAAINASKINWAATGSGAGIWWEELGRHTLGSAGLTLQVLTFTPRKYIQLRCAIVASGTGIVPTLRFNNDSANSYSLRISDNSAATGTFTSQSGITISGGVDGTAICVIDILNIATSEKPVTSVLTNTGGSSAGGTTSTRLQTSKWANTSSQITRVDITGNINFSAGSELVVLGHD